MPGHGERSSVADARMEYLIRDRLSWLRFLGFDLGAPTPDANTIRLFREKLTEAGTLQLLFDAFDHRLRTNGYLAMGGQIVDDEEAQPIRGIGENRMLVAAPKQRNTDAEKAAIKEGKTADEIWPDKPAKAAPARSTGASPLADRCRNGHPRPMARSQRCALWSNMSSRIRSIIWTCSFVPSASSAPRPRSHWQIWPTTSAACSSTSEGLRQDRGVQRTDNDQKSGPNRPQMGEPQPNNQKRRPKTLKSRS